MYMSAIWDGLLHVVGPGSGQFQSIFALPVAVFVHLVFG